MSAPATVQVGGATLPTTLRVADELPGLPGRSSYVLEPVADAAGLFTLRSLDGPPTRLYVVDPDAYLPGYEPELPGSGERRALVVVHPPTDDEPATANLLAPIVVDVATGAAAQLVLDGDWPLRAPLG
ncbi:hypothetical protein CWIS_02680 [Cellulomonas sp. A375-1]|uniref:Flagellar assembly protein FliW n=1 Tax=Cellulomonas gelida TaxID=1712 RepID=A0A4Y3KMV6_9CELL|nr:MULTISPECIES: flagellar assembly protein FliW [Cellulomonas]KMM46901.1 hypothetical protein CWIS_02680 [Cellulomonas sp. A375-1]GEA85307.1 hypothetical protein CGE01nite_25580 [Cellulomonas gelida]GGL16982.1 hypothetical protein GCM10009774_04180 [Cellulomonas gelida]